MALNAAEPERPLTVGLIFDYLESRQSQLLRDLDVTSVNGKASSVLSGGNKARPTKSPSPASSTTRQKSPVAKRTSPRPGNAASSPPRAAPWGSPPLPPTPLAEPAWSDLDAPKLSATGWPEISILPSLPVSPGATFSNGLPSVGGKRKRDALVDVDPRNAGNVYIDSHHRRSYGSSKKRKANINKGKTAFGPGNTDDWVMDLDDEITARDRKRPRT